MTNSNNSLIKQLRNIGLKQNESEIYLYLLEHGLSTPPQIAKGTAIARTNCYNILHSLLEKEVVSEQLRGKKKVYLARDPKSLKLNLERKIESVTRLLPDLEALHVTQKNKPLFQFYDGFEEVKEIYTLSLEAEKIYALGSIKRLADLDKSFFEKYIRGTQRKNIFFQDLLTHDSQNTAEIIRNSQNTRYSMKFLPEEYSKNITDLLIWNNTIALISLENPIFGTIITSQPLADTLRTILQLVWIHI